jgi:hypothetical protein
MVTVQIALLCCDVAYFGRWVQMLQMNILPTEDGDGTFLEIAMRNNKKTLFVCPFGNVHQISVHDSL